MADGTTNHIPDVIADPEWQRPEASQGGLPYGASEYRYLVREVRRCA